MNSTQTLEQIKFQLQNNIIESPTTLRNAIDELINSFWNSDKELRNSDLFSVDIHELCEFHSYLIDCVSKIHMNEQSSKNKTILKAEYNVAKALPQCDDSKRAHNIYTFNAHCDYVFIGDLHSDDASLTRALDVTEFYSKMLNNSSNKLIFTGDYVDRGHVHLKIMERLLILKYLFPENIFLLRGNHDGGILLEDGTIKFPYGIPAEDDRDMYFPHYLKHLEETNDSCSKDFLSSYLKFFNTLAYIACVKTNEHILFAVHGGIPRPLEDSTTPFSYISTLSDLTNEDIKDSLDRTICQNIMWSDPYKDDDNFRVKSGRFHFKQDSFDMFRKKFGIDTLIRGHEEAIEGHAHHLNDGCITVFSSGTKHCDHTGKLLHNNDESAYEDITPRVLYIDEKGTFSYL